ncbi:MAG: hypothetical protein FJ106_07620 [Deltaproteobacteria bacterium]|nr:hypothetical protein [Deltaproteobacteria bacterium]
MKGIELLKALQKIDKPFYTIADLEKVTGLQRNSLYVALKRGVAGGVIERVAQGIYLPMGSLISMETLAAQLYLPNYLSFESALAGYGILNLVPYTITFATPRKTKKSLLRKQEIEFRQISRDLFFGFEMKNGIYIASPEKAFLDQVYFLTRGKAAIDFDEIDTRKLSMKRLKDYVKSFPPYVRSQIENILH